MAKMIKTSCGYMTAQEAKLIGHIARAEKNQKKKENTHQNYHQYIASLGHGSIALK